MAEKLPSYKELPDGRAWGLWGADDELGCLNKITPEAITEAAALVRKGSAFPVNLRVDLPDPPLYGRGAVKVTIVGEGGNGRDDYLDNFWPQASSQWDSLRHIRHPRDGWYNGVSDEQIVGGGGKLGIENMARRGIVGRAVLLDLERYFRAEGRPLDCATSAEVTADDLEACRKSQGVEFRQGDVLLLHFGWLRWYVTEATEAEKVAMSDRNTLRASGLAATEAVAAYLWDSHVAAVAGDNPALEAWPPDWQRDDGFLHWRLIPHFGMPIGELWWLADLADDCAADGVYEGMFASAPLHVVGGVGSPPNAVVVK
jgi:kynurenine formamidase